MIGIDQIINLKNSNKYQINILKLVIMINNN